MTDIDNYNPALLAHGVVRLSRSCVDCTSGWKGEDGKVHCGASPDNDPPPPWAQRKYSARGLIAMMQDDKDKIQAMDCEDIDPQDAEDCGMFTRMIGHGEEAKS